jgi:GrpB-like predicted nucleotidyltransferase (UPF0157 family)
MEIADPDPRWPARYEEAAAEVARVLGPRLRAVEHVGSTAVPGLPAKPVIDVMAAVDALGDVPLPALAALGFEPRDTGMRGRLFLRREAEATDGGHPAVHLHVVPWDGFLGRKERRFRDRLRAHPEEARAYGEVKRALAAAHGDDADAYTRAKTAFIQEVMDRDADERGLPREEVWE